MDAVPIVPPLFRAPKTRHFTSYKQATDHELRTEQPERLAIRSIRIDDRGDFAVRVQRQELWRLLVVLVEVDQMHFVRQPDLLQHDRDLDAVWRRKRIELKAVRIFCGPARGNRKGGKVGHSHARCDQLFALSNNQVDDHTREIAVWELTRSMIFIAPGSQNVFGRKD